MIARGSTPERMLILLCTQRWVEDRLPTGTYREHYKGRLGNTIYKPLIEKVVEA